MTVETLTLIALWCGNPVNSTKGAFDVKTGAEVTIQEVNQCREQLRNCIKQEFEKHTMMDAHVVLNNAAETCTSQIQHPGRD